VIDYKEMIEAFKLKEFEKECVFKLPEGLAIDSVNICVTSPPGGVPSIAIFVFVCLYVRFHLKNVCRPRLHVTCGRSIYSFCDGSAMYFRFCG